MTINKIDEKMVIAKAVGIVLAANLISKVLGFVRETVLAAQFGASAATDAYLVGFVIPGILFGVVGAAITTVFIPVLNQYITKGQGDQAIRLENDVLHVILFLAVLLAVVGLVLTPGLVQLIAPGFEGPRHDLAVKLTRIMLPAIVFMGLSGWATGALNAHKHFAAPAAIGLPFNLILIASIWLGGRRYGIELVAVGSFIAIASQFLIQFPGLRKSGYRYISTFDLHNPDLRKMGVLILPVLIGTGAGNLNIFVDRMLASGLEVGSISALNFANKLVALPVGLFGLTLVTVLYPSLSEMASLEDIRKYQAILRRGLGVLALITIPITFGTVILRVELVKLAFQHGVFSSQDTERTAYALLFYSIAIMALAWRELLNRAFFAFQDTATPTAIGILSVVLNISLNLMLVGILGIGGLALATSIAAFVAVTILIIRLHKKIGGLDFLLLFKSLGKMVLAALFMAGVVWWLQVLGFRLFALTGSGLIMDIARLLVSVVVGAVVYYLFIMILKVEELSFGLELARRISRKLLSPM